MGHLSPRVALVYDRVNKWGGAERVLLALHELYPDAPLFTAVYNEKSAEWAKVFPKVIPTFLQHFPGAKTRHEFYAWATPLAFESLRFDEFDIVISITSADAKGIITKPGTLHICYCLTPTRYLWSHQDAYQKSLGWGEGIVDPLFRYLKRWDHIAASRPDAYISISKTVATRVKLYYGLDSSVVYPPVDIPTDDEPKADSGIGDFFLYVSRLVGYKRPDVVVQAFNELQLPLLVIGTGHMARQLKKLARSNVQLRGFVSDNELHRQYRDSRAIIFFHEEDFGIVPVEAMAQGTPVIGITRGGVAETVIHGTTGILTSDESIAGLMSAVRDFQNHVFDTKIIRKHAEQFSKERFKLQFSKHVSDIWAKYNKLTFNS